MDQDDKTEVSRREFLTWVAAGAAMLALPGYDAVSAGEPRRFLRTSAVAQMIDLDRAPVVIPDPPPAIVNPSTVTIPHEGYGQQAKASQHISLQSNVRVNYSQENYLRQHGYIQESYNQPTVVQTAYTMPAQPTYQVRQPQAMVAPAPVYAPAQPPAARAAPARGKVTAVSRNSWGATPAIPAKMRKMNGVRRVTIHHEGSAKPNNDASMHQVAATLRLIQSQHRKRMGAGDIGYHFIIDRTGVIWQGRDWAYQGAHTSGANSNNLGVMLLGNFEIQQPTMAQLQSLLSLTASLMRKYGLNPATDIFGHCDFVNTACPGKHLKSQVQALRRMRM